MPVQIRVAQPSDIPAIIALQMADAQHRARLNPRLWAIIPDAPARMTAALATIADPITGPVRHHWIVAEQGGALLGVIHGINLPAPPIYNPRGGTAGVLLDDSHVPAEAEIATALRTAAERAMEEAGAGVFVAASPIGWTARAAFFEAAGYQPTTGYFVKSALIAQALDTAVRPATEADVEGIVTLSALHRAALERANPDFWKIHPEADKRFGVWMSMSLGLADRSMFVTGEGGGVDGFIIAQPHSPLHLTAAHDGKKLGLIDDFCALAFDGDEAPADAGEPLTLLAAAERAFIARGYDAALAICPVKMPAKASIFERAGYRAANLWLVRRDRPD
jgi:hypothetical protein